MEDTVQNVNQEVNQNTNQKVNQNPAPINFDPRTLKENYSDSEWAVKEAWYPKILAQITIPADNPTSAHLQRAVVGLDVVAGVAFIDAAYAESNYLRYDQLMKVEEGNAYVAVQNGQTGSIQNKTKLSIDDTKALVTQYLSSHPYDNTPYNIYELVNISRKRREFMRKVIELIEGKKDMFITTSANLKLDSTISGMTPSVPQQNNPYSNMYQHSRSDYGDING